MGRFRLVYNRITGLKRKNTINVLLEPKKGFTPRRKVPQRRQGPLTISAFSLRFVYLTLRLCVRPYIQNMAFCTVPSSLPSGGRLGNSKASVLSFPSGRGERPRILKTARYSI